MKGLMILVNGFEDGEALVTRDLLMRANVTLVTASYNDNVMVKTAHNLDVIADTLLNKVILKDYDFLIIPGGGYVSQIIKNDILIKDAINHFNKQNKLIAAICAAPSFLGSLGILDNIEFTCYPTFEKYAPKGIYRPDQRVVVVDNLITSRSLGTVFDFSFEIIRFLKGNEAMEKIRIEIVY